MKNLSFRFVLCLLVAGVFLPMLGGQVNATTTILVVSSDRGGLEQPLLDLITGLGHTVDAAVLGELENDMGGPTSVANAARIAAADLVILARGVRAGRFNDRAWNDVTTPLLLMNPFLLDSDSDRLGWVNSLSPPLVGDMETDVTLDPAHPFSAGLSSPLTVLDLSGSSSPGTTDTQTRLPEVASLPTGAEVAATTEGGLAFAFSIPAGATTFNPDGTASTPFGGRRALLDAWSYPSGTGTGPHLYGAPFLTPGHEALLSNVIDALTIADDGLGGNFDGDLDVDGADFLEWQRTLGDAASLDLWEQTFGNTSPIATAAASTVPEPASLLLACMTAVAAIAGRRRSV